MMDTSITHHLSDAFSALNEGQSFSFTHRFTTTDIDHFAQLSGDSNPLHMDARYAQERGFDDRVVHGVLVAALISRMIGMYCPGEQALLQSFRIDFPAPTYPEEDLLVTATITQCSEATRCVMLKIVITHAQTAQVKARCSVQAGVRGD